MILFMQAFNESRDELPMTTRWDHVHQRRVVRLEPCPDGTTLISLDVLLQKHHLLSP
jgi:hypothetical protein